VKKRDNKRLYIYFVKHKRTIAGCRGIMLSRNIKQKDKKDGRWKTLHGISTSCLRFSSRHSPRTPKKDPNANCNQQTDINVKREAKDAKFSGEH